MQPALTMVDWCIIVRMEVDNAKRNSIAARLMNEPERSTITQVFEQEIAAFEQLKPGLFEKYAGQYVAIYQGEVVASGDEKLALLDQVRERFGDVVCYIEKVTPDSPRTIRMPSFRLVRS